MKTLFGHICTTRLKMPKDTFANLYVIKIFKNDPINEKIDLIVEFKEPKYLGYMYSLTKNLDKKDNLTLSEYIPGEFYKRHRELNAISKILRDKGLLTHIRLGNNDYNLYSKQKDDNTKLINVSPYKLTDEITSFEIGLLPTIEVNKKRKSDNNENNEKIVKIY